MVVYSAGWGPAGVGIGCYVLMADEIVVMGACVEGVYYVPDAAARVAVAVNAARVAVGPVVWLVVDAVAV